jgi:hypothetical protein
MLTFISDVRPRERTTTDSQFLFDQVGVNLDLVVLHVDALHNAGNTSEYERSVPASCERKMRRAGVEGRGKEEEGRKRTLIRVNPFVPGWMWPLSCSIVFPKTEIAIAIANTT